MQTPPAKPGLTFLLWVSCTTGLHRKAVIDQAAEALDGVERVKDEDAESLISSPSLTLC